MDMLLCQDFTGLNARVATLPGLPVLQSLRFQHPPWLPASSHSKNETKYIWYNFSKVVLLSATIWRLIHVFDMFYLILNGDCPL